MFVGKPDNTGAMLIKRKSIEKEASQRKSRKSVVTPVNISEDDGIRYLHFGTHWIQGAMRIKKPDRIELEYVQQMMAWMLFIPQPQHVVQLGLGTAALTKFCYRNLPDAQVTAVEIESRRHRCLPNHVQVAAER